MKTLPSHLAGSIVSCDEDEEPGLRSGLLSKDTIPPPENRLSAGTSLSCCSEVSYRLRWMLRPYRRPA